MRKYGIGMLTVCCASGMYGMSAHAQDTTSTQETHFKIYGGPAYVAPMSDEDVTFGSLEDTLEGETAVGWNLGFEGRFNRWFGLELDYVDANEDIDFGGTTIGESNFSPLTATFNIHVVHTTVVDFYLGPAYTYVNWGDIHLNASGSGITGSSDIGTDSSHGWGVSMGLDVGWKHFVFTGGLKYLNVSLEPQGLSSIPVNPLVARLGVGFRF